MEIQEFLKLPKELTIAFIPKLVKEHLRLGFWIQLRINQSSPHQSDIAHIGDCDMVEFLLPKNSCSSPMDHAQENVVISGGSGVDVNL